MSAFKRIKAGLRHILYGTQGLFGGYRVGVGTRISERALILPRHRGRIVVGRNCIIESHAILDASGGWIRVGDEVSINPFTILYGQGGLTVGNGVRIAAHCVIVPSNHNFADRDRPIRRQGLTNLGIVIEDDVWIGSHVTVLDGVRIAQGCVIAAGAVVSRSTEPFGVYAGVPARRIRDR